MLKNSIHENEKKNVKNFYHFLPLCYPEAHLSQRSTRNPKAIDCEHLNSICRLTKDASDIHHTSLTTAHALMCTLIIIFIVLINAFMALICGNVLT